MIPFFRKHSAVTVWVIVVTFVLTTIAGIVAQGFFSDGASAGKAEAWVSEADSVATVGTVSVGRMMYQQFFTDNLGLFRNTRPFHSPSPEVLEMLSTDAFAKSLQYFVLLDGAEKAKIKVTKAEIKSRITDILPQVGLKTEKELKALLKERQVDYKAFLNSQKQDVMVHKFTAFLQSHVTVSDEDVDRKYTEVQVKHILFRQSPDLDLAQVASASVAVKALIDQGLPFDEAVKLYSQDDSTRDKSGNLGWLGSDVLPAFYDQMHSLKEGEVSEPILTRFGYHLIMVTGRRDAIRPLDLNYEKEKNDSLNQKRQRAVEAYLESELMGKKFVFYDPMLEGHHSKREGNFETSKGAYQRAVSLNPNYSLPHYYLAQVYMSLGELALAKDELLKAAVKGELNQTHDLPAVHIALAEMYGVEKRLDEARLSLDRVFALVESDYLGLKQMESVVANFGSASQKLKLNRLIKEVEGKITEYIQKAQETHGRAPLQN